MSRGKQGNGNDNSKKRKALMAIGCSFTGEGCRVFLDDYDTKEKAYEALNDAVMEHIDYGIREIEVDE